jgi:hypothetical protein
MTRTRIITLLLALTFTVSVYAQDAAPAKTADATPAAPAKKPATPPQAFQTGGQSILIPTPVTDMVEVGNDTRKIMEVFVVPTNRLIAAFIPSRDMPFFETRQGEPPVLTRYAMAQTLRQGEFTEVGPKDFPQIVQSVETIFADDKVNLLLQAATDDVTRQLKALDIDEKLKIGEPVKLGTLFSKTDAYGFGMIATVSVGEKSMKIVTGGAIVRVKNRAMFLYVCTEYKKEETVAWLRNATEQWATAVLGLNK